MAASLGTRTILFGLLTVPVTLHKAADDKATPSLNQVHRADLAPIKQKTYCSAEDIELASGEVEKAYKLPGGAYLVLDPDELAALPIASRHVIAIQGFIKADSLDPIAYEKAYYLGTPRRIPEEPYVLLREALTRTGTYAVAKVSLSTTSGAESLAVIRPAGEILVLHTVRWPALLRKPDMAPSSDVTVRSTDLDMACELIERNSELDLQAVHDEYAKALNGLIRAKMKGEPQPHGAPTPGTAEVIDLTEALRKSLEHAGAETGPTARSKRRTAATKKASEARTSATTAKSSTPRTRAGERKSAATKRTASGTHKGR
jgi:DNA end-binding protein Ku